MTPNKQNIKFAKLLLVLDADPNRKMYNKLGNRVRKNLEWVIKCDPLSFSKNRKQFLNENIKGLDKMMNGYISNTWNSVKDTNYIERKYNELEL